MMATSLESFRRGLTAAEVRYLRAKSGNLSRTGRKALRAYLPVGAVILLALWLVTVLVADAPLLVITLFWIVIGVVIMLWVRRDMRKDAGQFEAIARGLDSALKRNAADVYDVRATAFAEFEEIEDEGACYAFDLEDGRLVFIAGQEFYPGARFPSLDFSLVYVLGENDQPVDMLIEKRGSKATPARIIPAATKNLLDVPDHLETRVGRIDTLEILLRAHGRR